MISPQPWGDIHVSKHHYAVELARRDNKVVFLNPLTLGRPKEALTVSPLTGTANLRIAKATLPIPSFLRFKWRSLYDRLIDVFASRLAARMGGFDIVWCFDPNYFHNLKRFAPVAIYHPVDPITEEFQITCGRFSDVIFSVSHEIINAFRNIPVPQFIINHGVSGPFRALALRNYENIDNYVYEKPVRLKFGYVGNLLRKEIDWTLIYAIIGQNPEVEFHFWGPSSLSQSNLAGDDSSETRNRIGILEKYPNVILHGSVPSKELPEAISIMDGFLLIYRFIKGQSDRSNSHKILEFLCTGKTLVSFRVKAYQSHPENLLVMPPDDNDALILPLFNKVAKEIDRYNNRDHVKKRLAFALEATYENNLNKIERILFSKEG